MAAMCRLSRQLVQVDRTLSRLDCAFEQYTHAIATCTLTAEFEEELSRKIPSVVLTTQACDALHIPASKIYWLRRQHPKASSTSSTPAAASPSEAESTAAGDLDQDLLGDLVGAMGDAVGSALNAVVGGDIAPVAPDSVTRYSMNIASAESLGALPMCTGETFLADHECSKYEHAVQRLIQ
jgi:hypothetical protein